MDLTPSCSVTGSGCGKKAIRAERYEILRDPEPLEKLNIAALAFAKDPDDYLVELIQKPSKQ